MLRKVSGQKDSVIVLLRDLTTEDGRRRNGLFFVEGEELVRRAFDYGGTTRELIVSEKFLSAPGIQDLITLADIAKVDSHIASEGLLAKILDAKPTPECLAIVERKVTPLPDILNADQALVLMLESGRNADNLGMLLRSADAAGVSGVVLSADTTDPFARRVVRGSRGAVFTVPISIQSDPTIVIEKAKSAGLQVIASSANAKLSYRAIEYNKPTLIVVGNEQTGISDAVRSISDAVVRIPMHGRVNSLNVAVAASVLLYEALRQRELGSQ
jgi:TrmH family RNA methyltransferase